MPLAVHGNHHQNQTGTVDWTPQTRSVNFSCGPPGCTANATLQVYNLVSEEVAKCKLSIGVHATDFDDDFSREVVEHLTVNGVRINTMCNPRAKGDCSAGTSTTNLTLFPCVSDYHIDNLVTTSGALHLTGKLSPMVDECPVNGNLLSGRATVTCFVRQLMPTTTLMPTVNARSMSTVGSSYTQTSVLHCQSPGCDATAHVKVDPTAAAGKKCSLSFTVSQTDFDGNEGSVEELEWVKVEGMTVREHVKPGGNPCQAAARNRSAAIVHDTFSVINGHNVTANMSDGLIEVSAKLSNMVDECGVGSFLLYGIVNVTCA